MVSNAYAIVRRTGAAMIIAALVSACSLDKSSAPAVSGPSEFGTSITLSASPEVLSQDGVSKAVITALVRDAASRPVKGVAIRWSAGASTPRVLPVTLSAATSVTDNDGRTAVVLTAPQPPTEAPVSPDVIIVSATPVADSVAEVQPRTIQVRLQPTADVPLANNAPVAKFDTSPGVGIVGQAITFDARTSTDEGEPCLSRCTYRWDFGDGISATGMTVSHTYAAASKYAVTLTVVDDRARVGTVQKDLDVTGPAGLVAHFTVSPVSPQVGADAVFDASSSQVGTGSVIVNYHWDFGDGDVQDTTTPTIIKRYGEARLFPVTLTVTPSAGAPATFGQAVQVVP